MSRGWIPSSLMLNIDQVAKLTTLDHAMLLEFTQLSIKILGSIALPVCFVLAPLHVFCGGYAAGDDVLSYQGMGNVEEGSWLYWVHAFVVWYVIMVTQVLIRAAQLKFMERRMLWLSEMPPLQATTVLVQQIPEGLASQRRLKDYFEYEVKLTVDKVWMVKDTTALQPLQAAASELQKSYEKLAANAAAGGKDSALAGLEQNRSLVLEQRVEMLRQRWQAAQEAVVLKRFAIDASDENVTSSAFVKFETRREAEAALRMFGSDGGESIVLSWAPDPVDVDWAELQCDPTMQSAKEILGYVLMVTLFFFIMPLVVGISSICNLRTLSGQVSFFKLLIEEYPAVAATWDGMVGSLALSQVMANLPTVMLLIIGSCFAAPTGLLKQAKLQQWYYAAQVIFVLLVTAVGSSLLQTAQELAAEPGKIFKLLATKLPESTHFYLNFMLLQWATHAINAVRLAQLFKYLWYRRSYTEQAAKKMAEPEAQDYYGMGARSAYFSLTLVTTLVFCTLSPLICVLGFMNFALCRMIYGYLFVYAEEVKPDSGGVFWVTQLKHIQLSLSLYIILMTGVLLDRADTVAPALIALSSGIFLALSYRKWVQDFPLQGLSFELANEYDTLVQGQGQHGKEMRNMMQGSEATYKQPELVASQPTQSSGAGIAGTLHAGWADGKATVTSWGHTVRGWFR
eukprot:TRINITY_DN22752_c0_g1_i2.p1 TRINITY_DN22752_c0_g1~~TRINITY_DN22752_c0_g1_i2.p1  ORF type:complete len:681 (-),score=197.31 TRINITY_DN22752_c0_g1_i2:142-2184(-)